MTTVLLTILKIIGIVLLVILGIMLFLLAVLLFVPVRYSVKGTVDNNITAEGKISWLCSILRYDFTFQEQELNGEVRIFGFRPRKKERVSEEELEEVVVPEVKDGVEEVVSDLVSNTVEEDDSEGKISKSVIESDSDKISPEEAAGRREQNPEMDFHTGRQNRKSSRPSGKNIFMRMWDKIKSFMKKIKNFFIGIQKRLTSFKEFVVKVKEIVTDTKNQYAVRRLWEELLYLLKHFGFRKIHTELTFALADPALTGQVLGVLCMMPFLYQYDFHIFPDFESESYYIRGSYDVKGRIQLIFLLVTAIRLLADKDIRSFLKKLLDHRE